MSPAVYSILLTLIAFCTGVAILPVFAKFSDTRKLLLAKRKIRASLYAFRLFGDEPRLVLRAQRQLLLWNARYLALIFKPAAIVLLPILFLLLQMDAIFGHRSLRPGDAVLVTARMADRVNLDAVRPELTGRGADVETPAVRLVPQHRVFWRIRATDMRPGNVSVQLSGAGVSGKSVQAGPGLHYLSMRRVSTLSQWLRYPAERRLPPGTDVRWIQVDYPDADTPIFGMRISWIVWFVVVSWTAMFALRKRFGVVI